MKIGCTFLIPPIFSPLPRDPDVLTAFFLHLRILQGLAAVCPNFGSIKTASATPVLAAASPMLSWSKSLQPGEARAPAPMFSWRRFLKAPMFIKLPLLLSDSSEDSAKSEDHDDTSHPVSPV